MDGNGPANRTHIVLLHLLQLTITIWGLQMDSDEFMFLRKSVFRLCCPASNLNVEQHLSGLCYEVCM